MSAPSLSKSRENCLKKRRFNTDIDARAAALDSMENNDKIWRLFVYDCPHCRGVHLTKSRSGKSEASQVLPDTPYVDALNYDGGAASYTRQSPMFSRRIQFYLMMKLTRLMRSGSRSAAYLASSPNYSLTESQ